MKHMYIPLFLLIVSIMMPALSIGQCSNFCRFAGDRDVPNVISNFDIDSPIGDIIDELRPHYPLHGIQITVGKADESYAAVCYNPGNDTQYYIRYGENFFRTVFSNQETKKAAYIILAHELAHIYLNHTLQKTNSEKRQIEELAADSMAGAVLARMGFDEDEIADVFSSLRLEHTETHPPLPVRLTYLKIGHQNASESFTLWFQDADGDGFGNPEITKRAINQPTGYVINPDDCYDQNSNVFPGQSNFFITHRGDGSFDYDCNGINDMQTQTMGRCHWGSNNPFGDTESKADPQGWLNFVPQCGESGTWLKDCDRGLGGKEEETEVRTQKCK